MKKIVCTFVLLTIMISTLFILFRYYTYNSYGIIDDNKLTKVNIEEVKDITSNLNTTNYLRYGFIDTSDIDDEIMFKQIIHTIKEGDYTELTIVPTKVMCQINNNLWFISVDPCKIKVISKETIANYMMKLFNSEKELIVNEIKFDGFHCKLKDKYYCHTTYYKSPTKSYSYIEKVYKDKNENYYVYEYYLYVDYSKEEICKKYYSEEFCADLKQEVPNLEDKIIKENGVYYKHIYSKNKNGEYYLKTSEVVN